MGYVYLLASGEYVTEAAGGVKTLGKPSFFSAFGQMRERSRFQTIFLLICFGS